ncbi:hypothetical protein CEP52_017498 [Fusarium oligoseptatum]|uniref:N-acetyltransferase domain-containing protein n=1 Tax=Fusarium oligoseptatum TaxID=2604345 RepID=A0A428RPZ4_9HYPO|nr:hypothetical protein CEP52_017498 [Fusarium oligoseptatum]
MAPSPAPSSPLPALDRLRFASPADIPRVGIVAVSGFPYSPVFDWERSDHTKFPQDTLLSYCHEFSAFIKSPDHIVLVATDKFDPGEGKYTKAVIPPNNGWPTPRPEDEVVVGVACWKLPPGSNRKGFLQNDDAPYPELLKNPMRDMDRNHCDELDKLCEAAEKQYFQGLATMEMVVVHPAYWKRGHGRRLVRWGIDLAEIDGVCQGVIAAEMGKSLYLSLGYEELEDLQFDGFHLSVMLYQVKRTNKEEGAALLHAAKCLLTSTTAAVELTLTTMLSIAYERLYDEKKRIHKKGVMVPKRSVLCWIPLVLVGLVFAVPGRPGSLARSSISRIVHGLSYRIFIAAAGSLHSRRSLDLEPGTDS